MTQENSKKLPRYKSCFVCGRDNLAGLDIQFRRNGDLVFASWSPEEKHRGYSDRVHGGVIASILDEAMGWAPTSELGKLCYSAELSVRFRLPVSVGQELRVEARLVEKRKRLLRTEGRLLDGDGSVHATATGTYLPLPREKMEEVLGYLYVEGDEGRPVTSADL